MRKKIVIGLLSLSILIIGIGVTFAYISNSVLSTPTTVTFSVNPNYRCSADGGGDITSSDVGLAPASCTNPNYAIQRVIKVNPQIDSNGTKVYMDLWLEIKDLGQGLSNSHNFKWALTTNPNSCTENVVRSGNFYKYQIGEKINILKDISFTRTTTDTYYLYIWLDLKESSRTTMNQSFHLTLNGDCNDDYVNEETYLVNNFSYSSSSVFLNTEIKRSEIATLTFADSLDGHSASDESTFDVGSVQNGKILAWISPSEEYEGLYDIVIGQEGGVKVPSYSRGLFMSLTNVVEIDISKIDTSSVTNMGEMFRDCGNLVNLDISNFDTYNVTNMQWMFVSCRNLIKLDVFHFNTINVTNMSGVFQGCSSITILDVSNFDVKNVNSLSTIFYNCGELTSLDLSHWNMVNISNISSMFLGCTNLKDINLNNWKLEKVTNILDMIAYDSNLSNESLNSILLALTTAEKIENKTLSQIYLSNRQKNIIPTLSNYQAFLDAGWTID